MRGFDWLIRNLAAALSQSALYVQRLCKWAEQSGTAKFLTPSEWNSRATETLHYTSAWNLSSVIIFFFFKRFSEFIKRIYIYINGITEWRLAFFSWNNNNILIFFNALLMRALLSCLKFRLHGEIHELPHRGSACRARAVWSSAPKCCPGSGGSSRSAPGAVPRCVHERAAVLRTARASLHRNPAHQPRVRAVDPREPATSTTPPIHRSVSCSLPTPVHLLHAFYSALSCCVLFHF